MDAEIFKQIKKLAAKFNKDKNDLLEEAAQDLIKKYKNQEPSLDFSDQNEVLFWMLNWSSIFPILRLTYHKVVLLFKRLPYLT